MILVERISLFWCGSADAGWEDGRAAGATGGGSVPGPLGLRAPAIICNACAYQELVGETAKAASVVLVLTAGCLDAPADRASVESLVVD